MVGIKCKPGCTCGRHTSRVRTTEHKAKLSLALKGRKLKHERTAEHKAKLSLAMKGRRPEAALLHPPPRGVHPITKEPARGRSISPYGYVILTGQQGHPLAAKNGAISEHRKVLYDKIGPGVHACHWCGKQIEWLSPVRAMQICVDHLDEDKQNNAPENLVPSCFLCNWRCRGR